MSVDQEGCQITLKQRELLFKNHPFFYLMSDDDTEQFVSQLEEFYFKKGDVIVRENDVVDRIYFVAKGDIEITRVVSTVEKTIVKHISSLKKGDAIGLAQTGFFSTSGLRTATATALSPVILLSIQLPLLYKLSNYPALRNIGEQFLLMNFIRQTALFDTLSNDSIRRLAKCVTKMNFPKGTKIFSKNDQADKCYLVLFGQVVVKNSEENGLESKQTILDPGSFLGEEALFSNGRYAISMYAQTDCELFELTRKTILDFVESHRSDTSFLKRIWDRIASFF